MILNSLQEPSAESKHITGIVPPGLRLDGLCQQSRQRHRDRFSVFKRDQQGYGIAALVDKFELYRLAVVESFERRELAAADHHVFVSPPSVCAGVDFAAIWNPRVASELSKYPQATIVGRRACKPIPGQSTKRLPLDNAIFVWI